MANKWDVEFTDDYIHRQHFQGKGHRDTNELRDYKTERPLREFIAWDGEGTEVHEPLDVKEGLYCWHDMSDGTLQQGSDIFIKYKRKPQPYVTLANSKGARISAQEGLSTWDCFDLLLNEKQKYPWSIFVGFGLNYDINQMLKDIPEDRLWKLYNNNWTSIAGYYIKWIPRKSFYVKHGATNRSMIIYDIFSFFQCSFLEACKTYLGEDLDIIEQGKQARDAFKWDELDEFIIPYNNAELALTVKMMDILRKDFHSVGIRPRQWHGPGAVASQVYNINHISLSRDIPIEVLDASQYAYSGGRFELFKMGHHPNTIYTYDINSAYPKAATNLPDISAGHWEHTEQFEPETFGVWHIDYKRRVGTRGGPHKPQPLFCRSRQGLISYPTQVRGWYWTPEAELVPDSVTDGWIFRPDTNDRPFSFIERMYEERRILKDQGNSSQRALKLILNSLYGKLAQTVGGNGGPPKWHQLEYAGYITSYTRAQMFNAIELAGDNIISAETDAIFSTAPIDLPQSNALGDWKEEKYDEITYLQSGFYYAITDGEVECKYRGLDTDRETKQPLGLPYRHVLSHLRDHTARPIRPAHPLSSYTKRFIGLGYGLCTRSVWRSWENNMRNISIDDRLGRGKRVHLNSTCNICQQGITMDRQMHPLKIGGYYGKCYPTQLPWRVVGEGGEELDFDWKDFERNDQWQ